MRHSNLNFRAIASGSAGCCYLLSGGGAASPLLLECGIPLPQIQQALSYQVSKVAGCLVSHGHGDHAYAAKKLDRELRVGIWCSGETAHSLGIVSTYGHLSHEIAMRVGDWTVTAFDAQHDSPGTLGFVIDSPEGDRLLYLTDSNYSKFTFDGLTHIACEVNHDVDLVMANMRTEEIDRNHGRRTLQTHMSLDTFLDLLAANDLSRLVEIHVLHLSDANSDEAMFKKRIQEAAGVPVYIAPAREGR